MNLAAAEQQLASSRAAFEHQIGRPAETLAEHGLPILPEQQEKALGVALDYNPTLGQSHAEARAADHNVDTAVGALMPSLSVQAQYGRSIDEIAPGVRENGVSVLGQLTIPLYQGLGSLACEQSRIRSGIKPSRGERDGLSGFDHGVACWLSQHHRHSQCGAGVAAIKDHCSRSAGK
jgi:outer membrane protein TolC